MILTRVAVVAGFLFASTVGAQGWSPQRNVEVIVPSTAGGSLDTTGRTVTRIWGDLKFLPVSSTIANRAGGGHAVAYSYLNQRAGDPHYLCITSSTLLANHINGHIPLTYNVHAVIEQDHGVVRLCNVDIGEFGNFAHMLRSK